MAFQFRLQRILELGEKREKESAGKLAAARNAAETAHEAQHALEAQHTQSIESLADTRTRGAPVGELRSVGLMIEHLNRQIQEARSVADAADEGVRILVEEFTAAFRDRRALDLLRQRDHDAWKAGEIEADRQAMDGIALTRFVQSISSGSEAASR